METGRRLSDAGSCWLDGGTLLVHSARDMALAWVSTLVADTSTHLAEAKKAADKEKAAKVAGKLNMVSSSCFRDSNVSD